MNRVITGKDVVLTAQVSSLWRRWFPPLPILDGPPEFLQAMMSFATRCTRPYTCASDAQVAAALFVVGKIGGWFTSLGLMYTGAAPALAVARQASLLLTN